MELGAVLQQAVHRGRKIERRPDLKMRARLDSSKILRIDADDTERHVVQPDGSANHGWVAAKAAGPVCVTDYGHLVGARLYIVLRTDRPPDRGHHFQTSIEISRNQE